MMTQTITDNEVNTIKQNQKSTQITFLYDILTLGNEDAMLPQMVKVIFHAILGYTAENTAPYSMDSSTTQLQKSQNSQQNTDVEETQNCHNVQCKTHLLLGPFVTRKLDPTKEIKRRRMSRTISF